MQYRVDSAYPLLAPLLSLKLPVLWLVLNLRWKALRFPSHFKSAAFALESTFYKTFSHTYNTAQACYRGTLSLSDQNENYGNSPSFCLFSATRLGLEISIFFCPFFFYGTPSQLRRHTSVPWHTAWKTHLRPCRLESTVHCRQHSCRSQGLRTPRLPHTTRLLSILAHREKEGDTQAHEEVSL